MRAKSHSVSAITSIHGLIDNKLPFDVVFCALSEIFTVTEIKFNSFGEKDKLNNNEIDKNEVHKFNDILRSFNLSINDLIYISKTNVGMRKGLATSSSYLANIGFILAHYCNKEDNEIANLLSKFSFSATSSLYGGINYFDIEKNKIVILDKKKEFQKQLIIFSIELSNLRDKEKLHSLVSKNINYNAIINNLKNLRYDLINYIETNNFNKFIQTFKNYNEIHFDLIEKSNSNQVIWNKKDFKILETLKQIENQTNLFVTSFNSGPSLFLYANTVNKMKIKELLDSKKINYLINEITNGTRQI